MEYRPGHRFGVRPLTGPVRSIYQIHMLPINIYFGENHYLDKITMRPNSSTGASMKAATTPKPPR
jgi:fatty acid-binding protein DegV